MATISYIPEHKQTPGAMKAVMNYCMQEKKTVEPETGIRFVSGVKCIGINSVTEFIATKTAFGKEDGIQFYQYVQSFSPRENISHAKAHEIALEFAEKAWPGYEVQVCTHCDASHIHSHFVINSVSAETGKKLRQNPNTLKNLRKLSDEICEAHGFSTLMPYEKNGQKLSSREYRAAASGNSWKFQLMFSIGQAMKTCITKDDFLRNMEQKGYTVIWTPERKHITFQCPNGKKCRSSKLHDPKYGKENLENEFLIRESYARDFLAGQIDFPKRGSTRAAHGRTLSADPVRTAGKMEGSRTENDVREPAVSERGVQTDFRNAESESDEFPFAILEERDFGSGVQNAQFAVTGWERERGLLLKNLEQLRRYQNANGRAAETDEAYRYSHRNPVLRNLGFALYRFALQLGMSDEEILSSAIGAALGVTIAAGMLIAKEFTATDEEEVIEAEEFQEETLESSMEMNM